MSCKLDKKNSSSILKIKVLPAGCGDCLLVSFGYKNDMKNILIDGGIGRTYKELKKEIEHIISQDQYIDLLIVTHSHNDHINGIIKFIEDEKNNNCIKKIWFNSGVHFDREKVEMLTQSNGVDISSRKIKYLEDVLMSMECMEQKIWNNELIMQGHITNIGDAKMTVLSPDEAGLEKLRRFTKEQRDLDIAGKDYDFSTKLMDFNLDIFEEDNSVENATSISFMFEYSNRRILFLADSLPKMVLDGLLKTKLLKDNKQIDYVKLSHHASKGNLNDELLKSIECKNYIVSTHGNCSNRLPNKETFARIVKHFKSINLYFNYRNDVIENIFFNGETSGKDYEIDIIYLPEQNYEIEVENDN